MSGQLSSSVGEIARDAAGMLAVCLARAPFAREAVVVDSSSDDTVEVARCRGTGAGTQPRPGLGPPKRRAETPP
jgi:hypothetical protein